MRKPDKGLAPEEESRITHEVFKEMASKFGDDWALFLEEGSKYDPPKMMKELRKICDRKLQLLKLKLKDNPDLDPAREIAKTKLTIFNKLRAQLQNLKSHPDLILKNNIEGVISGELNPSLLFEQAEGLKDLSKEQLGERIEAMMIALDEEKLKSQKKSPDKEFRQQALADDSSSYRRAIALQSKKLAEDLYNNFQYVLSLKAGPQINVLKTMGPENLFRLGILGYMKQAFPDSIDIVPLYLDDDETRVHRFLEQKVDEAKQLPDDLHNDEMERWFNNTMVEILGILKEEAPGCFVSEPEKEPAVAQNLYMREGFRQPQDDSDLHCDDIRSRRSEPGT